MKKLPVAKPLLSSRVLFAAALSPVAVFIASPASAMVVDGRYDLGDYQDFAYNVGQYSVGAKNVVVYRRDGTTTSRAIEIVPNFDSFAFHQTSVNGGAGLIAPQYMLGAAHVLRSESTFYFFLDDGSTTTYSEASSTTYDYDGATIRLKKIVTDVASMPLCTDTTILTTLGSSQRMLYHLGTGSFGGVEMTSGQTPGTIDVDPDPNVIRTVQKPLAGTLTATSNSSQKASGNYRITTQLDRTAENPLDHNLISGDSGSTLYVYNETLGRFETLGVLSTCVYNQIWGAYSNFEYNPTATQAFIEASDSDIVSTTDSAAAIVWNDATTETLTQGETSWIYHGSTHGSDARGIIFENTGTGTQEISLAGDIDMGYGSITFRSGDFVIKSSSENSAATIVDSAGFIIEKGASVRTEFSGESGSEWRKVGEGTLIIGGSGDHDISLNVGGGVYYFDENGNVLRENNETRLDREGGYAAKSIKLSAGVATIVLMRDGQINGSNFEFGNAGGTLNLNGQNLSWDTITHMDAGATFSNKKLADATTAPAESTFTFTGTGTFKGTFTDGGSAENGLLHVVYDNANSGATWTLTGVAENAGGITVENGSLIAAGTQTRHMQSGSTNYLDFTWASIQTSVAVENSSKFTLGAHAQMTGDVAVNGSGEFELQSTVTYANERVQGGVIEDVTTLAGLLGNVSLNSSTAKMTVNANSSVPTIFSGNISGTGNFEKIGTGTFSLSGTNSLSGTKTVSAGTLVLENAESVGDVSTNRWKIDSDAVLQLGEKAFSANAENFPALIDTASSGVFALTQNLSQQIDISAHSELFIGAASGTTVEYGDAETTLAANANGEWRLGGGGGTLNVNFKLTGANNLVIGNETTSGTVNLTNTANDFSGTISIGGLNNFLTYSDIAALGSARISVGYGNEINIGDGSLLASVSTDSAGVLALSSADGSAISSAIDFSGRKSALGSVGETHFSGTLTPASDGYRFGGDGTLILDTTVSGNSAISVDAQGFSGGNIVFNQENSDFTGTVTIGGKLDTASSASTGSISASLGNGNALKNASAIVLKNGGTLLLTAENSALDGTISSEGSGKISNATDTAKTLTLGNAGDWTIAGSVFSGKIDLVKSGAGTLTLSGTSSSRAGDLTIASGTLAGTVRSGSSSFGATGGTITVADGATLDLKLGASIAVKSSGVMDMSRSVLNQKLAGTGTIVVHGGDKWSSSYTVSVAGFFSQTITYSSTLASVIVSQQSDAFEGTLKLSDNTRLILGSGAGNLSALGQKTKIVVENGSQARITPSANNGATDATGNDVYSDFTISGTGFAGTGTYSQLTVNNDNPYAAGAQESVNAGALSVDYGSTVYGNVTLAADATIASNKYFNASTAGGKIYGEIFGEGKTLTVGGTQRMEFRADAANTFGALVVANGNTLALGGGAAQSTTSSALGTGAVSLGANTLRFENAGTADTSVVYTYANEISAGNGATIASANNTTALTGSVALTGATLNLATENGSVLQLAGGLSGDSGKTVSVAESSNIELGASSGKTFSGTISAGEGATLSLLAGAENAYAAATLNFSGNGALNFSGTGTFTVAGISVATTDETSAATALSLGFDFTSGTACGALSVATFSADGALVSVELNEAGDLKKGEYTIISADVSEKTFALADGQNSRLSLTNNGTGGLTLVVDADARLFWKNISGNTTWDATETHWTSDAGTQIFSAGADVAFGAAGVASENSASARETVSLASGIETGAVWVKDETFYTFSGDGGISGENASLNVYGASLRLENGANTFAAGVSVSKNGETAGELVAVSAGALTDSAISLKAGGTLDIGAAGALAGSTTVAFDGGALKFSVAADVSEFLRSGTGAATLDFAGQNVSLKNLSELSATEIVLKNSASGTTSAVTLGAADSAFALAAGSSLDIGDGVSATHYASGSADAISGAGDYTLVGTLSVGDISAHAGTLKISGENSALTVSTTLENGAAFSKKITGEGTLSLALGGGDGDGNRISGLENFSGTLAVSAGTLNVGGSSLGTETKISAASGTTLAFTETGSTTASATFAGAGTISVASGADGDFSGAISASGTIAKTGAGTATFSGGATFGTLNLNGGNVNFYGDATLSNFEMKSSGATVNVGDANAETAVVVSVARFNAGDVQSGSADKIVVAKNATLEISGSSNDSSYSSASFLLGEWGVSTTLSVLGNVFSKNAKALVGDTGMTLDIAGGTLAVSGIGVASIKSGKTQSASLKISDGGKLLLGANGIGSGVTKNWSSSLGAGTLGAFASSVSVAPDLTFAAASGDVTTIDTTRYDFSDDGKSIARGTETASLVFSGAASGDGALAISGAGTAEFSGTFSVAGTTTISDSATLRLSGETSGAGAIVVNSGATLDLAGTILVSDFSKSFATNNGTVKFSDGLCFALSGASADFGETGTSVALFDAGSGTMGAFSGTLSKENFTWNGGRLGGRTTFSFDETTGTVSLSGDVAYNLTWRGGESGTWLNSDNGAFSTGGVSGETTTAFAAFDNVTLATAGAQISLGEKIEVAALTVSESATLTASSEKTFFAESVEIASGATLTLAGGRENFSWNAASVSEGATLDLGEIAGSSTAAVSATLSGAGTVKMTNTNTTDHTVSADFSGITGTVDFTGNFNWNTVSLGSDATLVLSRADGTTTSMWGSSAKTISNAVSLATDYEARLEDANLEFSGTVSGAEKTLTVSDKNRGGKTLTFSGTTALGALKKTAKSDVIFSGDATVNSLEISAGTVTLKNTAADSGARKIFSAVSLASGTTLQLFSGSYGDNAEKTAVGALTLGGDASLAQTNHGGYWHVKTLSLASDVSSATLTLSAGHTSSVAAIYELGDASNDAGNFAGKILLNQTASGKNRHAAIVLSSENVAKNAVISFGTSSASDTNTSLLLGVNADTVRVGGLESNSAKASQTFVFSGHLAVNTNKQAAFASSWIQDGDTTRTLVVDTAAGTDTTYYGAILGNVLLEKTGAGTQTLAGASASFDGGVNVSAGTLVAANAAALGTGAVTISGGVLEISEGVELSAGALSIVLEGRDASTAAISGAGTLASGTTITVVAESAETVSATSDATAKSARARRAVAAVAADSVVDETVTGVVTRRYQIFEEGTTLSNSFSENLFALDSASAADGWEISGYDASTGILSLTLVAIPEPSAFGLLAGLGALALAVARRRRSLKN